MGLWYLGVQGYLNPLWIPGVSSGTPHCCSISGRTGSPIGWGGKSVQVSALCAAKVTQLVCKNHYGQAYSCPRDWRLLASWERGCLELVGTSRQYGTGEFKGVFQFVLLSGEEWSYRTSDVFFFLVCTKFCAVENWFNLVIYIIVDWCISKATVMVWYPC